MTKGLQAKLARSLDSANTKARKKAAPIPAPLPAERKCTKLSVSLFDGDLRRLEAIQDYMRERGERISTSQAVKLALRTAPLSDALQAALEAVRSEDGRKW
jgi:hypothetical protein